MDVLIAQKPNVAAPSLLRENFVQGRDPASSFDVQSLFNIGNLHQATDTASPHAAPDTQSSGSPPNKGPNRQRKKGKSPEKGATNHVAEKGAQKQEAGNGTTADVAGLAYGTHTPTTVNIPAPIELLNR